MTRLIASVRPDVAFLRDMSDAKLVQPVANGSYLWPYTSRRKATSGRTLAINLVIHGDDERVKTVLTEQTTLDWELTVPTNNSTQPPRNETTPAINGTNSSTAQPAKAEGNPTTPTRTVTSTGGQTDANGSARGTVSTP